MKTKKVMGRLVRISSVQKARRDYPSWGCKSCFPFPPFPTLLPALPCYFKKCGCSGYVKVYLSSLKAKYDAYRVKKQETYATEMMATRIHIIQPENNTDGGWVENKVGKLYVSPLPDGIGNCVHLPMHDGCPDSPHCPTCPKLRANKRHLPVWENKATNLLITVEALRANPAYARARQKHEQELAHAEKVIKTIKEEGFWDGRIHNSKTHEK
jgi:hypothetical protein